MLDDGKTGGPILLVNKKMEKFLVQPDQGMQKYSRLGVIDTSKLYGIKMGSTVEFAGEPYICLTPSITDIIEVSKRGAQIIMQKDGAEIIMGCGLSPGSKILEIGTGSGHLTMMMAWVIGPTGHITSYEINERSAKLARSNVANASLSNTVDILAEDGLKCDDKDMHDVAVIDNPEPWRFLDMVEDALKVGGFFCAYVPSMNQVETTVKELRGRNFIDIRAQETLLRNLVVGEKGTRPDFQMLGHTGYLCFGRYLGSK